MAGVQVGFQQQQVVVGLARAQLGHPLGCFPVLHAAVVVAGHGEDRRVGLGADVFVGRVRLDPRIDLGVVRVAPLVVLGDGQRQVGVLHGVEHIDERHFGNRCGKQLGALVEHRAD